MVDEIFSKDDVEVLKTYGKSIDQARKEYMILQKGLPFVNITRAATIENGGIKAFSDSEKKQYLKLGLKVLNSNDIIKFQPASGSASRMFKDLLWFHSNHGKFTIDDIKKEYPEIYDFIIHFHSNIDNFAFFDEIKYLFDKHNPDSELSLNDYNNLSQVLSLLLKEDGMNYENTPKAFLKFHKYSVDDVRDVFEEQIVEGLTIGFKKFHFTFSPEHEDLAKKRISEVKKKYSDYDFDIEYSFQDSSTNTVSVDLRTKKLYHTKDGKLLLRMGGHGTLLNNINSLNEGFVYMKNIDNASIEAMRDISLETIKFNLGYLEYLKERIFNFIERLRIGRYDPVEISEFIENELCIKLPENCNDSIFFDLLNRPIKVCQMVPNEGEPGGGPVFIKNNDGFEFLTISEQQEAEGGKNNVHMSKGTHFNPVNLVMYTKDYKGESFDLSKFMNWDRCFLSEKSAEGNSVLALEYPGLWNGATEDFITVFIEAPIETFNPVKTVNDLLRYGHQVKKN